MISVILCVALCELGVTVCGMGKGMGCGCWRISSEEDIWSGVGESNRWERAWDVGVGEYKVRKIFGLAWEKVTDGKGHGMWVLENIR